MTENVFNSEKTRRRRRENEIVGFCAFNSMVSVFGKCARSVWFNAKGTSESFNDYLLRFGLDMRIQVT